MAKAVPQRRLATARPLEAGLGSIALTDLTRESLVEEIVRRARQQITPVELWLVDRPSLKLRRPAAGRLQKQLTLPLEGDDDPAAWPDLLKLPGPAVSVVFERLSAAIGKPALVRTMRAPGRLDVTGLLLAAYQGRRPPISLDRDLAHLASQAAALLSNLEALTSARERARQLSALYETAHHLSSEIDLDRVLSTICRHARALTGAEAAYIMLIDPIRGDAYVRVTDGVRTEAFRNARLELGQGLGGLVAKEGVPHYSSDYINDSRFVHVLDDVVMAEGLVSVMGVPLKDASGVTGVLFAAYRSTRTFSEENVSFLQALAEHAAIVLTNARLHKQTREALSRERRLHRIAEKQRDALERAGLLHRELTELVLAERGVEELLAEIGTALGTTVYFEESEPDGPAAPVAAGTSILGWLRVGEQMDPDDMPGLEQAARVVALHLLRERAVVQTEYRIRGEFLDELIQVDPGNAEHVTRKGSYLGIDLSRPLVVMHVAFGESDDDHVDSVSRAMQQLSHGSLVAARGGGIVVVAPGTEPRPMAERLCSVLARSHDGAVTIGIATEPVVLQELSEAIAEARLTARAGRAAGHSNEVLTRDQLGVYAVLLDGGADLSNFAEKKLRPLLDHDRRHDSSLVPTLQAYLDAGASATEAARRLIVHVNSLYYRLNRIREIGGYDLDNPDERFELQLAIRVLKGLSPEGPSS